MNQEHPLQQALQACRTALWCVGFFSFFVNILMLTVPIYMLQIFDRVLASQSFDTLIYLTLIAITALCILGLLDLTRNRVLIVVGAWLDKKIGPPALEQCPDEILSGRFYGGQSLRDLTTIRQFIGGAGILALFDIPWLPVYLIVIFMLHPWLGMLGTFGAIVILALAIANELLTRKLLQEANMRALQTQRQTDAALRNSEAIQAMGMMPGIVNHWKGKNKEVLDLQVKASKRSGIILATTKFLRLSLQLLILGIGAYFVVQNELTPGGMIAASILLSRALAPIEQGITTWRMLLQAREAYKRLNEHFLNSSPRIAGVELPKPKGFINLENVFYKLNQQEKPILSNISFKIEPGEMIAVIGPSGAGKSTLARLVTGCWRASAGHVRLDNADVYSWDRAHFGNYCGYLPQDIELFPGTIKDNIARMGEVDDKALIAASQLAGVHEMILHFPAGYETEIQTGMFNLSGGQRQRIALARALYNNPQILILDEPNANLDHDGEAALQKALLTLRERGTTIILISHRTGIVSIVDKILYLGEGKVQAYGPRDEVLTQIQAAVTDQKAIGSDKHD